MKEKLLGNPSVSFVLNSSTLKPDINKRNYKELFGHSIAATDEGGTFRPPAR